MFFGELFTVVINNEIEPLSEHVEQPYHVQFHALSYQDIYYRSLTAEQVYTYLSHALQNQGASYADTAPCEPDRHLRR